MKNSALSVWGLTIVRMAIGWHFLYEGLWKLMAGGEWSCAGYLRLARGPLAGLLQGIAENAALVQACDWSVKLGLTCIGLGLIFGVLARAAGFFGILLLAMFYFAQPPWLVAGGENHFLYLNYNALEALALVAIVCAPGAGLWTVAKGLWARRRAAKKDDLAADAVQVTYPERREMIAGLATLPVAAAFGGAFLGKHGLDAFSSKKRGTEAQTSASYRFKYQGIGELKKKLDQFVTIGDFKMSRITMGGNLIGGWAHSRDLGYVNTLMKAYNTPRRIFDTLHLAEACGINTISTNPSLMNFIHRYWKEDGGTINFVSDCGHPDVNGEPGTIVGAKKSVDAGAKLIYIFGHVTDTLAGKGDWKSLQKYLDEMRKLGVPVGIGAHAYGAVKFCIDHDVIPDFWMKTFHPGGYWSAQKTDKDGGEGEPGSYQKGWRDNNWCRDPKALMDLFEKRPEPWIAFKTMAAGAVHPRQAIPFVFNGGADAACMGMFDFQVVEDVNLATDAFAKGFKDRKRAWH